MKNNPYLLAAVLLAACHSAPKTIHWQNASGGMQYQTATTGTGRKVQAGNWLRLELTQLYNDSLLHAHEVQTLHLAKTEQAVETYRIFSGVHEGDSIVFRVPEDTAFAHMRHKPAFAKGKGWLYTTVKVKKIFNTEQEMKAAK